MIQNGAAVKGRAPGVVRGLLHAFQNRANILQFFFEYMWDPHPQITVSAILGKCGDRPKELSPLRPT